MTIIKRQQSDATNRALKPTMEQAVLVCGLLMLVIVSCHFNLLTNLHKMLGEKKSLQYLYDLKLRVLKYFMVLKL